MWRSSYHYSLALTSLLPPDAWAVSTFRAALGDGMRTWFFCPLFPMCICFGSRQTTDALATCGADELREKRIHTYWTVQDRQYCVYYHNIDFFVVQAETKRLQSCFACVHGYEMEVFVKTRRTRMRRLGELTLTPSLPYVTPGSNSTQDVDSPTTTTATDNKGNMLFDRKDKKIRHDVVCPTILQVAITLSLASHEPGGQH